MANRAPTRNTIILRSQHGQREEAPAWASVVNILPGQLLSVVQGTLLTPGNETRTVKPHAVAGGAAERYFAVEDGEQGKTILGGYPVLPLFSGGGSVAGYLPGDIVMGRLFLPGDVVFARIQKGTVVTGFEPLMSAGDGSLIVAPDGLLYRNTAPSAAVTNTVVETLFDKNYTFPANFFQVGDIIKIRAQVIATATNGTDTLLLKFYLGGLTGIAIVSTGAVDVANNDIGYMDITIEIRTIGAAGTLTATGTVSLGASGTATAKVFFLGSTAIDTTTSKVAGVGATWSVANAGNSARLDILTIELARKCAIIGYACDAVDNSAGDNTLNSTQTTDEFCAVRLL